LFRLDDRDPIVRWREYQDLVVVVMQAALDAIFDATIKEPSCPRSQSTQLIITSSFNLLLFLNPLILLIHTHLRFANLSVVSLFIIIHPARGRGETGWRRSPAHPMHPAPGCISEINEHKISIVVRWPFFNWILLLIGLSSRVGETGVVVDLNDVVVTDSSASARKMIQEWKAIQQKTRKQI
jgi:hypothetical protein